MSISSHQDWTEFDAIVTLHWTKLELFLKDNSALSASGEPDERLELVPEAKDAVNRLLDSEEGLTISQVSDLILQKIRRMVKTRIVDYVLNSSCDDADSRLWLFHDTHSTGFMYTWTIMKSIFWDSEDAERPQNDRADEQWEKSKQIIGEVLFPSLGEVFSRAILSHISSVRKDRRKQVRPFSQHIKAALRVLVKNSLFESVVLAPFAQTSRNYYKKLATTWDRLPLPIHFIYFIESLITEEGIIEEVLPPGMHFPHAQHYLYESLLSFIDRMEIEQACGSAPSVKINVEDVMSAYEEFTAAEPKGLLDLCRNLLREFVDHETKHFLSHRGLEFVSNQGWGVSCVLVLINYLYELYGRHILESNVHYKYVLFKAIGETVSAKYDFKNPGISIFVENRIKDMIETELYSRDGPGNAEESGMADEACLLLCCLPDTGIYFERHIHSLSNRVTQTRKGFGNMEVAFLRRAGNLFPQLPQVWNMGTMLRDCWRYEKNLNDFLLWKKSLHPSLLSSIRHSPALTVMELRADSWPLPPMLGLRLPEKLAFVQKVYRAYFDRQLVFESPTRSFVWGYTIGRVLVEANLWNQNGETALKLVVSPVQIAVLDIFNEIDDIMFIDLVEKLTFSENGEEVVGNALRGLLNPFELLKKSPAVDKFAQDDILTLNKNFETGERLLELC